MPYGSERETVRHAGDAYQMSYVLVRSNRTVVDGGYVSDLADAKKLAKEVSEIERDLILVYPEKSGSPDNLAAWTDPVARYENGKDYPTHFVAFIEGLTNADSDALAAAGMEFRHTIAAESEGIPYLIQAKHADDAEAMIREALPDWQGRIRVVGPREASDAEVWDAEDGR